MLCLVVEGDGGVQRGLGVQEGEELQAGRRLRSPSHKGRDTCTKMDADYEGRLCLRGSGNIAVTLFLRI